VKRTQTVRIIKRDGSREPFDIAKVRACLVRAMRSARQSTRFAEDLARAVALHLQGWSEPSPPTSAYILRCVHSVLRETGMNRAARYLAHAHRMREAGRRAVQVVDRQGRRGRAWSKVSVVRHLQRQYGLRRTTARFLAGQVEQRILALGYTAVSRALLAEVVRTELRAWGLMQETAGRAAPCSAPGAAASSERKR